jgi:hypothetical protein
LGFDALLEWRGPGTAPTAPVATASAVAGFNAGDGFAAGFNAGEGFTAGFNAGEGFTAGFNAGEGFPAAPLAAAATLFPPAGGADAAATPPSVTVNSTWCDAASTAVGENCAL